MRKLINLELSIPAMTELETRRLMGGSGYDINGGELPEVPVYGEAPGGWDDDGYDLGWLDDLCDPNHYDDDRYDDGWGSNSHNNDNSHANDPIHELKNQLNTQERELINKLGITININPNLSVPGNYNIETNTVTLQDYNATVLQQELIHAMQDYLNIANDASRSNMEFQEHLLGDIMEIYNNNGALGNSTVTDADYGKYYDWLYNITQGADDTKGFDKDTFLKGYHDFYESFIEKYHDTSYSHGQNENYDWHWDSFFDLLGINNIGREIAPSHNITMPY